MDILHSLIVVTLLKFSPLLFTGLAVALAFRGGLWNIGAEGQFLAGAVAATWIGVQPWNLPPLLWVPFALVAGALAGALWGFIPGLLRVTRHVPEVISTILLNFVAYELVSYLVHGPLQEKARTYPMSDVVHPSAQLLSLNDGNQLHMGLFFALIAAVGCFFLLFRTAPGYCVRAVGHNEKATRVAGFSVGKIRLLLFAGSGALAALGGAVEVLGVSHRLFERFSPGYGFAAIAVALLARLHPLWICLSALFFAALYAGAGTLERVAKIPSVAVYLVQALVIFAVLVMSLRRRNA